MINDITKDILDTLIEKHSADPLEVTHYMLTQHLLQDGVKGSDDYQTALGQMWRSCLVAFEKRKEYKLAEYLDIMQDSWKKR